MGEVTRGERLQIMLTQGELEALDNWRFGKRMPSRAAAVRELLKRGLAADGFSTADGALKARHLGVRGKPARERVQLDLPPLWWRGRIAAQAGGGAAGVVSASPPPTLMG